MSRPPRRRLLVPGALAVGVALVAALVTVLAHARGLRAVAGSSRARRERAAVVQLVGVSDLAVSSSSRWLRHPSLSEPGAAFTDAPGMLDTDPAGAVIAPRQALYQRTERALVQVRRGAGGARR